MELIPVAVVHENETKALRLLYKAAREMADLLAWAGENDDAIFGNSGAAKEFCDAFRQADQLLRTADAAEGKNLLRDYSATLESLEQRLDEKDRVYDADTRYMRAVEEAFIAFDSEFARGAGRGSAAYQRLHSLIFDGE